MFDGVRTEWSESDGAVSDRNLRKVYCVVKNENKQMRVMDVAKFVRPQLHTRQNY